MIPPEQIREAVEALERGEFNRADRLLVAMDDEFPRPSNPLRGLVCGSPNRSRPARIHPRNPGATFLARL